MRETTANPFPHLTRNKRRFVRFPAMFRVEYTVDARTTFVFTQDLSLGGMQLRNAKGLLRGAKVKFHLHLLDVGRPVAIDGSVQRVGGSGVGITFTAGQDAAIKAIGEFIDQRLISRSAERVVGAGGTASQIADLAMYYCETGRVDDAIELYRKSLHKRPHEAVLYEDMSTLLLYRAQQGSHDGEALLNELETLIARGIGLGKSRVLDMVSREMGAARAVVTKRQEAARQEEKARLFKEADARAEVAIAKAVADKARELEHAFREKPMQRAIAAQQKKLDRDAAKLDKEHERLELAQKKLKAANEALKAKVHDVEVREREVGRREARVATLEKMSQLIDGLHQANVALRPVTPMMPKRSN